MMPALRSHLPLRALVGASLLSVALAQSDVKGRITAMLPDNGQAAEVMEVGLDDEIRDIQTRLRQAQRQDPRWFSSYSSSHAADPFLPYHPKFGITEREYERFLTDSGIRVVRSGRTARVNVTIVGGKAIFQGGVGAEALKGIVLNIATGELKLPEGPSARPHTVYVNGRTDDTGLGTRSGYGWKLSMSGQNGMSIWANFNLVQLAGGAVLLAFNKVTVVNGRYQPEINLNLLFEKKSTFSKAVN